MPVQLSQLHTQRKITGSLMLLVMLFALLLPVTAVATPHLSAAPVVEEVTETSPCVSDLSPTSHLSMELSEACSAAESGCWQCSYCTTLVGTIERNSLLYTELSHFSLLEAATPFATRLDRPPKPS